MATTSTPAQLRMAGTCRAAAPPAPTTPKRKGIRGLPDRLPEPLDPRERALEPVGRLREWSVRPVLCHPGEVVRHLLHRGQRQAFDQDDPARHEGERPARLALRGDD